MSEHCVTFKRTYQQELSLILRINHEFNKLHFRTRSKIFRTPMNNSLKETRTSIARDPANNTTNTVPYSRLEPSFLLVIIKVHINIENIVKKPQNQKLLIIYEIATLVIPN